MNKHKESMVKELKEYIDIASDECCGGCEKCCKEQECVLWQMLNGFTNVFGVGLFGLDRDKK